MNKKKINNIYGFLLLIIIWYSASFIIGEKMIPTPITTISELFKLMKKNFFYDISYSTYRIFIAIFVSLIIGIPIGIFIGINKVADRILSPLIYILYPIPKVAFLPIFMVMFGLGNLSKIMLMVTIIIFQILIVTRDGVKDIDNDMLIAAKVMKFNKVDMIIKVIIPSILPNIFSALRVSIGIAISALFFSENYATKYGIGYFIMNAWSMVDYKGMFAGVLALSIVALIIFKLIDLFEKKICKWI